MTTEYVTECSEKLVPIGFGKEVLKSKVLIRKMCPREHKFFSVPRSMTWGSWKSDDQLINYQRIQSEI